MHATSLPNEIWFEIFDYLSVHNIFESFSNLNQHFDDLLSSSQLLFKIELKSENNNNPEHLCNCYRSFSSLNRVISLKSSINHNYDYFPEFIRNQSTKLTQLRSLLIKGNTKEVPSICQFLSQTHTLQSLSLTCIPNQNLLESILACSSLRQCRLYFWRVTTMIHSQFSTNSHIETLFIKLNDDVNHSIMTLLLSHLPKLKKLEIIEENCLNKTTHPLFDCQLNRLEELENLKLTWGYHSIQSYQLQNLSTKMPHLKHLSLTMFYLTIDQILNRNLLDQLIGILKDRIEMNITIHCRRLKNTKENDLAEILKKFCQDISTRITKQINGYVKMFWTEDMIKLTFNKYLAFQNCF